MGDETSGWCNDKKYTSYREKVGRKFCVHNV